LEFESLAAVTTMKRYAFINMKQCLALTRHCICHCMVYDIYI